MMEDKTKDIKPNDVSGSNNNQTIPDLIIINDCGLEDSDLEIIWHDAMGNIIEEDTGVTFNNPGITIKDFYNNILGTERAKEMLKILGI